MREDPLDRVLIDDRGEQLARPSAVAAGQRVEQETPSASTCAGAQRLSIGGRRVAEIFSAS
jgi:hypothetical protein